MAVSDVHSPKYLFHYMAALSRASKACREAIAVLWAGDMVLRGNVRALAPVLEATKARCGDKPIIAVYGNEEYMGTEEEYKKAYPAITWLDDSYTVLELGGGVRVCVYGTRGSLDRPTRWQRRHIRGIKEIYLSRVRRAREELKKLRDTGCTYVILLSHYAPTYATLEGEPPSIWPEMGSRLFEAVLREARPDVAIHGHAHNSKKHVVHVDGVLVVNVALPARMDVTLLRLVKGGGVELVEG